MSSIARHQIGAITIAVTVHETVDAKHPPVVLLPGAGNTADDWREIAADLAHDRTVFAVDLRGHGRSDRPGVYSIDLMAQDVRGLLHRLDGPVDLIGHSLGGLVASRAVAADPAPVRRLVLEDVGVPHARPPAPPQRPGGTLDFDWAVVEQVRPQIDRPASHWPDTFALIATPTLVIGGGDSSFVPQDSVAELVDIAPDARLATIDAGHEIHRAAPAEFLRVVRSFLTV